MLMAGETSQLSWFCSEMQETALTTQLRCSVGWLICPFVLFAILRMGTSLPYYLLRCSISSQYGTLLPYYLPRCSISSHSQSKYIIFNTVTPPQALLLQWLRTIQILHSTTPQYFVLVLICNVRFMRFSKPYESRMFECPLELLYLSRLDWLSQFGFALSDCFVSIRETFPCAHTFQVEILIERKPLSRHIKIENYR